MARGWSCLEIEWLIKVVLKCKLNRKRTLGGSKHRWMDKVKNNLTVIGIRVAILEHRIGTGGSRCVLR